LERYELCLTVSSSDNIQTLYAWNARLHQPLRRYADSSAVKNARRSISDVISLERSLIMDPRAVFNNDIKLFPFDEVIVFNTALIFVGTEQ
jgi:hypothetical protein